MSDFSGLKLVTKADAAAIFSVCVKSIENYIAQGLLPPPIQFASKEYWHPEHFIAFLDERFKPAATSVISHAAQTLKTAAVTASLGAAPSSEQVRLKDSNPVFRQAARQKEKLKALNS